MRSFRSYGIPPLLGRLESLGWYIPGDSPLDGQFVSISVLERGDVLILFHRYFVVTFAFAFIFYCELTRDTCPAYLFYIRFGPGLHRERGLAHIKINGTGSRILI